MAKSPVVLFAHQPPQITILSDHASQDRCDEQMANDAAATLADRDQLNLETRLASTFDILRHKNTRCPLAVAVYGDWGTGKTSAMRWLETRLNEWNTLENHNRNGHPRAYPVWFDPWRYHSKEEVWRGIIAEVILSLFRVNHLNHENALPRMVQAVKKFGGFLGRSFIHAMANLEIEAGGKAKLPGVAEGEVKFTAKGEMFRDIWEEYEKAAQPQKAHLNQFEDTLRTWVTDFLGPQATSDKKATNVTHEPARLVLFIDDLDRCLPEVTLEVIEALKLYLNIDHLIFVVGLDETVVRSVVAQHYSKAGVDPAKAGRYLDKVFQVDIRIPPSEAQMPGYMETQIAALNEATAGYWHTIMDLSGYRETLESVLISLARNNPREVKRLLNSALLRGRAASLDESLTDKEGILDRQKRMQEPTLWHEQKSAERFAQGVQVFLLQRLLADRLVQSEDLLTYSQHLKWFAKASRLLREALKKSEFDLEALLAYLPHIEDTGTKTPAAIGSQEDIDSAWAQPSNQEGLEACAILHNHLAKTPPKPDSVLWTSELFLQLLQVPFSQAVAEHFPPTRSTDIAVASPPLDLAKLPDSVRERLAATAKVPLADLRPEHLRSLTELKLDGLAVTSSELRSLLLGTSLEIISLQNCTALTDTDALAEQRQLLRLVLAGCIGLKETKAFQGLAGLENLIGLDMIGCTGLAETTVLSELSQLQWLYLNGCTGLQGQKAFEGLTALKKLQRLYLKDCKGLESLPDLSAIRGLKVLDLSRCTGLQGPEALGGITGLAQLETLVLSGCTGLKVMPDLTAMQGLKTLDLSHCTGLSNSDSRQTLNKLPKLKNLLVSDGMPWHRKDDGAIWETLGSQCKISWR